MRGGEKKETGLKEKNAKPTGCRGVRRADQRGQTRMSGGMERGRAAEERRSKRRSNEEKN